MCLSVEVIPQEISGSRFGISPRISASGKGDYFVLVVAYHAWHTTFLWIVGGGWLSDLLPKEDEAKKR